MGMGIVFNCHVWLPEGAFAHMDQGEIHICCRSRKVLVGPEDTTMGENVVEVVVNTRIQLPAVSTSESTIRQCLVGLDRGNETIWKNERQKGECPRPQHVSGQPYLLAPFSNWCCPIMFKASRRNDSLNPAYPPVMSNDGKIIELNRGLMTFPLPFSMTGGYCIGNIAVARCCK